MASSKGLFSLPFEVREHIYDFIILDILGQSFAVYGEYEAIKLKTPETDLSCISRLSLELLQRWYQRTEILDIAPDLPANWLDIDCDMCIGKVAKHYREHGYQPYDKLLNRFNKFQLNLEEDLFLRRTGDPCDADWTPYEDEYEVSYITLPRSNAPASDAGTSPNVPTSDISDSPPPEFPLFGPPGVRFNGIMRPIIIHLPPARSAVAPEAGERSAETDGQASNIVSNSDEHEANMSDGQTQGHDENDDDAVQRNNEGETTQADDEGETAPDNTNAVIAAPPTYNPPPPPPPPPPQFITFNTNRDTWSWTTEDLEEDASPEGEDKPICQFDLLLKHFNQRTATSRVSIRLNVAPLVAPSKNCNTIAELQRAAQGIAAMRALPNVNVRLQWSGRAQRGHGPLRSRTYPNSSVQGFLLRYNEFCKQLALVGLSMADVEDVPDIARAEAEGWSKEAKDRCLVLVDEWREHKEAEAARRGEDYDDDEDDDEDDDDDE